MESCCPTPERGKGSWEASAAWDAFGPVAVLDALKSRSGSKKLQAWLEETGTAPGLLSGEGWLPFERGGGPEACRQPPRGFGPGAEGERGKRREECPGRDQQAPGRNPEVCSRGSPPLGIACFPCQKGRCRPAALRSRIQHSPAEGAVRPSSTQSLRGRMPKTVGFKWGVEAAAPLHKRPSPSLLTQSDCATSGPGHLRNDTRPAPSWGPPRSKARAVPPLAASGTSRSLAGQRGRGWQPPSGKGRGGCTAERHVPSVFSRGCPC